MAKTEAPKMTRRTFLGASSAAVIGHAITHIARKDSDMPLSKNLHQKEATPYSKLALEYQNAIHNVIHSDVAQSVKLPNGKILWVFGDATEINGVPTRNEFPHNVFVLQEPGTLNFKAIERIQGGYQQVPNWTQIENGKEVVDSVFWPTCPIVEGDKLYLLGSRVKEDANGFTVGNPYVAVFDVSANTSAPIFEKVVELPGGSDGITWGGAIRGTNNGEQGWWVSGSHNVSETEKAGDFAFVRNGRFENMDAWQIKKNVIPASEHIGTILDMVKTNGRYEGVTKQDDMLGNKIESLRTSSLAGIWTVESKTYSATGPKDTITYAIALHPEQPSPRGYMLASYSVLDTKKGVEKDDYPRFIYLPI